MKELTLPCGENDVRALKAGDRVSLSGLVYTGRDRLHKFFIEGGESPEPLAGCGIFHCGPLVARDEASASGWRIVAAGPTTSIREEPYMPGIIERHGIRAIIGKGGMGRGTAEACKRLGCVYLMAVGGAAALIARKIMAIEGVWFADEFGPTEAMWKLRVEGLELLVGMDAYGASILR